MKNILFCLLFVSATLGLKAQTLTIAPFLNKPKKNNIWTDKRADSIVRKFSFQPNQKALTLSDSNKRIIEQNKYMYAYDRMPVAKLQSDDIMPIFKLQNNSKMPVYNPDNSSLINLTKPTLKP